MSKNKKTKVDKEYAKKLKKATKEVMPILIAETIPIVAFKDREGYFVCEDGKLVDIFQIACKDLVFASDDEQIADNLVYDKLYKVYADDLKMVSFNFPTDTAEQQTYIRHMLDKTKNPVYREKLYEKLNMIEYISQTRADREFYLFFFGKNEDDLREKQAAIYGLLSRTAQPLVRKISNQKKKNIFYKLCNPNQNF